MPVMQHFSSVDAYIAAQPQDKQKPLQQLRETIQKAAPGAEESISYGMPGYKYLGRPLVYFSACKTHFGFYALPTATEAFRDKLAEFDCSKGTIRFPLDKPLPLKLIRELVHFRVAENRKVTEEKQFIQQQKKIKKTTSKQTS